MPPPAILLHSSWRAASTYVWAKFRARPDAYCYFEPLAEMLATVTADELDRFRPWSFAHPPPLDAPYLEEFRRLIESAGGVRGFPAALSYGGYRADHGTALPALEAYFAGLRSVARSVGKSPVHGLVRSSLRVGWFKARVPGVHFFVRREPRSQFLSILNQAVKGNPYFLQRGLVILNANRDDPAFAPLLAAIDLPALVKSLDPRAGTGEGFAWQPFVAQFYTIFFVLHRMAVAAGEQHADLILDIDAMSADPAQQCAVEQGIADLTGWHVSFADCRAPRYDQSLGWSAASFEALERWISTSIMPAASA